ncbi:hypothetical protein E2C01_041210 [Portunus trituberculatus]|uniref:Uncharacterized protein n=1 Tax=Portunus trituberculatus TaxID=210409 RepID=A0A5B7FR31_PORTR|nr:hypothetical protein [Portunus trituberculatus]
MPTQPAHSLPSSHHSATPLVQLYHASQSSSPLHQPSPVPPKTTPHAPSPSSIPRPLLPIHSSLSSATYPHPFPLPVTVLQVSPHAR